MGIAIVLAAAIAGSAPAAPGAARLYTTPYFQNLGIAAGLPSSRVYKVVQDKDGYLWFGTQDGLARYDGVGFRVFRHDPADPGSLAGNAVSALFVDRDNRIWCGAEESGLDRLDGARGAFVHHRHDAADPASLASDDVYAIAQDDRGAIWVGSYAGGLDRLDTGSGTFIHHRHAAADPRTLGSDTVLVLSMLHGRLWIGTVDGIDVLDPADESVRHVDLAGAPGTGKVNAIALHDAGDGAVFAGTRRGLLRVGPDLSAVAVADLAGKPVYGIARSGADELWLASQHGLIRRSGGAVVGYNENPGVPGTFRGDMVFDALRDREGSLWFATFEAGVVQLPAAWRNFALFRTDPADASTLSTNRTEGLAFDPAGRVWAVNYDGGIDRLDPASGRVERFATRLPAPDKSLWSIAEDHRGQLWVGHTRGLRVYDLRSGAFEDLPVAAQRSDALAPGLVYHILVDAGGAIWADAAASDGAVHRIDAASHRIERFGVGGSGLRNAEIDQLGFDPAGNLLVASAAGIDRFDAGSGRFAAVAGAPEQRVYAFAFAGDGTLWLHVPGALEHYRSAGAALRLVERVDARAGWPALTAGGLQVDAGGSVWVSSPRGLWRYDPARRAIRVFDSRDGLASSEFNRLPLIRRADGAIFGGTLAGVAGFIPSSLVEDDTSAPPLIDAVFVRRGAADVTLDGRHAVALRWDDRDLRIVARALNLANPAANRYRWKLAGFDSGWVDTGTRGEREFSQLPPGEYRLELRAANAAGAWSALGAPLAIGIARPPCATPMAYAAYALAVLLALAAAVRGYRNRLRRRYALEAAEQQRRFAEQASAAKSEFLATMGHEIRTPMTGVLGMAELLLHTPLDERQAGYAQAILDSGRLMLRLVNDSLDLARIEAGKFELDEAPFAPRDLLAQVGAWGQPLARAKGLDWELAIAADVPRRLRGDALRIQQILLNLVNNAIKFSERGAVRVVAAAGSMGGLRIEVHDDGPGVPEPARARLFQRFEQTDSGRRRGGSGLGLAICRELVARMGGEITLASEAGKGSTFCVDLPLAAAGAVDSAPGAPAAMPLVAADTARTILLVEDDATVAEVIAGLLRAHGYRVTHAAHGLAALAALDAAACDCALIDLDLPGLDGLALARMLRAGATSARLPLVGVSARSAGDEEALCRAAGMDAFLRKPVTGAALARCIEASVAARAPASVMQ